MEELKKMSTDPDMRVRQAVEESMAIYCNKLSNGRIDSGLEASFQHELALILRNVLELKTLGKKERFSLALERKKDLNGDPDYVDIAIDYEGADSREYLIELKFKKKEHGASDFAVIDTYFDLYDLYCLRQEDSNVHDCYLIFLTDTKIYSNAPVGDGNRAHLPMHDGAKIEAGQKYMASSEKACERVYKRYGDSFDGFVFNKDLTFNYHHFKTKDNEDYWFYLQEI